MRRILSLSLLCVAAGYLSACNKLDEVVSNPVGPTGGVRFINAVPDTGAAFGLDFRFVDIVEAQNNAQFRIAFRNLPAISAGVTASTQIEFKPVQAGSRHFRIFLDDTLQSVASIILKDTSMTV
jgi:hypothetical protein